MTTRRRTPRIVALEDQIVTELQSVHPDRFTARELGDRIIDLRYGTRHMYTGDTTYIASRLARDGRIGMEQEMIGARVRRNFYFALAPAPVNWSPDPFDASDRT